MMYFVSIPAKRSPLYRVTFNGQDVTAICTGADDDNDWVKVWVTTQDGWLVDFLGNPVTVRLEGEVEIERRFKLGGADGS